MSAPLWMPGVQRLDCSARGLGLGFGNNTDAYHTWHTFEGIPANYNYSPMAGARYLSSTNKLAHFTFNPVLGGIVQLLRADQGARTLQAGPRGLPNEQMQTNARGRRHFQTEVLANAARPWTLDLTRAGLDDLTRLMNFMRAHGVVDQWAWRDVVRPAATYAEANRVGYRRMPDRSGHAFHSKWPWNTHWDPGAIAAPWEVIAPPATPGRDGDVFFEGSDGPDVHEWQTNLAALGYDLVGVGLFGPKTTAATRAFQSDHGITVDGRVGPVSRTTMENTMRKLDDLARQIEALGRKIDANHTAQTRTLTQILGAVTKVAADVWTYALYGFPAHWWVRRGGILDPGHRHFPADPGSPADKELRAEALESGRATVYGPDGTAVLIELDPDTNRFKIKED